MNNSEKGSWRFPSNQYANENGLETGDVDSFKRDPIASLARETCQNSIDARLGEHKVRMEFETFTINKNDIPGYETLLNQVEACQEYQKNNAKDSKGLKYIHDCLVKDDIECLRISDYYTKGLLGVSAPSSAKEPFYLITKGSGITNKSGIQGGSKGIGKFASFVASNFNTVFYSTLNKDGEIGSMGICKLCSAQLNKDSDEITQGIGYFASDYKNSPILSQAQLEKGYSRETPGTDVYILGFKKDNSWKSEIITKLLDSFMCAIYYDDLELQVGDVYISKDNLKDVVYDQKLVTKKDEKNIKSQYILLTDPTVYSEKIQIEGKWEVDLFLKRFTKEESNLATNQCVMIRYPYMKIKSLNNIAGIPCSAMCIINKNELNEKLRDIENAQHTNWELQRIDDPEIRSEVKNIIDNFTDTIKEFIHNHLIISDDKNLDIEGAGDFLPDIDALGDVDKPALSKQDKPSFVKSVKNRVSDKNGQSKDDDGDSLQPEIGIHTEDGNNSQIPEGHNNGHNGAVHDGENETGYSKEGDNVVLVHEQLSGMHYTPIAIDPSDGKYALIFNSLYSEENCSLELYYLDDSNNKYKVNIKECIINDLEASIDDGVVKNISLENGKRYKLILNTDLDDIYPLEVKVYANR